MNTLQTIWSALTVENEMLVKILSIPIAYLDAYIGMLFFTTLLNIDVSKKRKLAYVLIYGTYWFPFILHVFLWPQNSLR